MFIHDYLKHLMFVIASSPPVKTAYNLGEAIQ